MSKDIKQFLHYYLGCEGYEYSQTVKFKLTPERLVSILSSNIPFKPILRPLSDMTEEEAADVYTIERDRILHSPTNDVDVRQRTDFGWVVTRLDHLNVGLLIKYDGVCYKVINEGKRPAIEPAMNQPLIFHYLLSKYFDLFGLIEAGIAIDKTKQGI